MNQAQFDDDNLSGEQRAARERWKDKPIWGSTNPMRKLFDQHRQSSHKDTLEEPEEPEDDE